MQRVSLQSFNSSHAFAVRTLKGSKEKYRCFRPALSKMEIPFPLKAYATTGRGSFDIMAAQCRKLIPEGI